MAECGQVRAYLVGAARLRLGQDEGDGPVVGEDAVGSMRRLAIRIGDDQPPVRWVARERQRNLASRGHGYAVSHGEIPFADAALLELADQATPAALGPGEQDDAGSVAVQPVEEAGPRAAVGVFPGGEGVEKCAVRVLVSGVDDDPRRFVHGENVVIFVEDRRLPGRDVMERLLALLAGIRRAGNRHGGMRFHVSSEDEPEGRGGGIGPTTCEL